jgi:hypothetical protein
MRWPSRREKGHVEFCWEKFRERDHLKGLVVDGKLKYLAQGKGR